MHIWKFSDRKVFVYRNLHQDCWSVKARGGLNAGRVILHCESVNLHLAHFDVNEKGRQKVLQERRKNVHAGVVGWLSSAVVLEERYASGWASNDLEPRGTHGEVPPRFAEGWEEVTYNPYKFASFVFKATELPAEGNNFCVNLRADKSVVAKHLGQHPA